MFHVMVCSQSITWVYAELFSIGPCKQTSVKFKSKYNDFHSRKMHKKMSFASCSPFCSGFTLLTGSIFLNFSWPFHWQHVNMAVILENNLQIKIADNKRCLQLVLGIKFKQMNNQHWTEEWVDTKIMPLKSFMNQYKCGPFLRHRD